MVSSVIVRHIDGDFLLMQRDYRKEVYPGMYEASITGGAIKGESAEQCALIELKEEAGIECSYLKYISTCVDKESHVIFRIFLCETDCSKNSIILQEGETISYLWMEQNGFLEFIETDEYIKSDKINKQSYFNLLCK